MIYINLLLVFICIVFIHEFGHYLFARIFKADVTDFSIGFGKPIFKFRDKNNTIWKICPIPLGGYVKIKGLDSVFQKNSNQDPGSFQALKLYQKIFILLAGSVFNIISAWIALFCIFFFFGIASFLPIIGTVMDNSAAQENDLMQLQDINLHEGNHKHLRNFYFYIAYILNLCIHQILSSLTYSFLAYKYVFFTL